MNKQTTIKILGHTYQIEIKPIQFEENSQGFHWHNKLLIQVDSMIEQSQQEEVLLHELIEALNYRLELKLEHAILTTLSEGLYQALHDAGFLKIGIFDKEKK